MRAGGLFAYSVFTVARQGASMCFQREGEPGVSILASNQLLTFGLDGMPLTGVAGQAIVGTFLPTCRGVSHQLSRKWRQKCQIGKRTWLTSVTNDLKA